MKKTACIFMLLSLIFSMLGCQAANSGMIPDDAYVGMSVDEFRKSHPKESCLYILDYAFYNDQQGNEVMAVLDARGGPECQYIVQEIYKYPDVNASLENFEKIKAGMTIYEVSELIGCPVGCFTSGMFTLTYLIEDDSVCTIYYSTNHPVVVNEICFEKLPITS